MNRKDVVAARDAAERFVTLCDELLEMKYRSWDPDTGKYIERPWVETWLIAGKTSGAHRRASLDLTRALSHMRRRQ